MLTRTAQGDKTQPERLIVMQSDCKSIFRVNKGIERFRSERKRVVVVPFAREKTMDRADLVFSRAQASENLLKVVEGLLYVLNISLYVRIQIHVVSLSSLVFDTCLSQASWMSS